MKIMFFTLIYLYAILGVIAVLQAFQLIRRLFELINTC